jgi:hypothetical protein
MRYKITLLLIALSLTVLAQIPTLVNYQGVARDANGVPLSNQNISVKFDIHQGNAAGTVVYTDDQPFSAFGIKTNTLGLFNTQIGKASGLLQVNWPGGPYYLEVSIDLTGGTNYVSMGAQQIVSVPFALNSINVPSSYTSNVLTIGTKTHVINTTPITLTTTGSNLTLSGGPNYTLSSAQPTLALTSNNASISILGSNTIALPAATSPTLYSAGIATVNNGAPSFTIGVPAPTYDPINATLSFGTNNTLVTPTLVINNSTGVLYSGIPSNSIALPSGVTVSGAGAAVVTGSPNYVVTVPQPSLALSSNNQSLTVIGSNYSVALPSAVTVTAPAGNMVTVTGGPTNYGVSVPNPSYNGTVLTMGPTSTTIAPTLNLSGNILTSGATTNSVNLANFGPWRQAAGSVTLATATDNVGINAPGAPTSKLEVWGAAAGTVPVVKVINQNASNTSGALDVSTNGALGLQVSNNNATGIGAVFNATVGAALNTQNNSNAFSTIISQNSDNTSTSTYAGYFNGGLVAQAKSLVGGYAFNARNSSSSDLFVVRNDGKVGLGTNTPLENFQIETTTNSQLSIISTSLSNILFGSSGLHNEGAISYNTATDGMSFWTNNVADRLYIDLAGNVGVGAGTSLAAKLDVNGNARLNSGKLFLGSVGGINSGYTGIYNNSGDLVLSVFKSGAAATTFAPAGNSIDAMIIKNTTGNVGIGTLAPSTALHINGSSPGAFRISDGSEGVGKVLTSDASGNATWQLSTITTTANFSGVSIGGTVTTTPSSFGNLASFTKINADTKVEVILQTHIYVDDLQSTNAVTFELKLGTITASGNSGKVSYFIDNNSLGSPQTYKSVTVIAEFFNLSTGTYNVTMEAHANTIGQATNLSIDPGNYGTNSLIIKEYR